MGHDRQTGPDDCDVDFYQLRKELRMYSRVVAMLGKSNRSLLQVMPMKTMNLDGA